MRPRQVRYQAALRPDIATSLILNHFPTHATVSNIDRVKTVTKRQVGAQTVTKLQVFTDGGTGLVASSSSSRG